MKRSDSMASREELSALYDGHSQKVYGWSRRLGLSAKDAEDAVQEVFLTACRKGVRSQEDHEPVAWLYQITRRVAANMRRLNWLKKVVLIGEGEKVPDVGNCRGGDPSVNLAVREVIGKMKFKHAEVLLLHDLDGYTQDQIARMVGVSQGAVVGRLRVARSEFLRRWDRGQAGRLESDAS